MDQRLSSFLQHSTVAGHLGLLLATDPTVECQDSGLRNANPFPTLSIICASEGSLTECGEGYTFFWKGVPEGQPLIQGIAFAIGRSERLMQWCIPLTKNCHLSIISVYAPTLPTDETTKDRYYALLGTTLQTIPREDKLILLGHFNARVGSDHHLWGKVLGCHGTGKCNANGLRLLSYCSTHELAITNTMYQLRDMHKTTWMHPRSKQWHLIDFVFTHQKDHKDVMITRTMRGADGGTDHRLVRKKLNLKIRPPVCRCAPPAHLNICALQDANTLSTFKADRYQWPFDH
ncbi:hypothetical protein Pcinc_024986 [Petrolisthes cinctipes]|uniref:Craniofacial development protein 2 n=1 Tax=Petrolisthes cinctipes TaxID=88211 RepID=A0AAE1F9I2_PETCI|nr:hypothetical protein Pcinc_024986 [Petrolisthes cinctipes]